MKKESKHVQSMESEFDRFPFPRPRVIASTCKLYKYRYTCGGGALDKLQGKTSNKILVTACIPSSFFF